MLPMHVDHPYVQVMATRPGSIADESDSDDDEVCHVSYTYHSMPHVLQLAPCNGSVHP
jgi:hypothetical protein